MFPPFAAQRVCMVRRALVRRAARGTRQRGRAPRACGPGARECAPAPAVLSGAARSAQRGAA